MGVIISSTLGCGKDELIDEYSDKIKIHDISDIEINDEFINKVNDLSDDNDILFVSSSDDVIDKLIESKIDFDLFYPSKERRTEFIENQVKIRAPFDIIRNLDMNFAKNINRIDSIEGDNVYKHKMSNKGEYIYNNNKILKYIENTISSGNKGKK